MGEITLGSLFDGIGGFPYAASFYGIRALWASEIVPECVSVTRRHFPGMAHVGDIRRIHGRELEPVDIITFGSPCQGLSMAGRRRGLADERSGLFMEAVRVIDEMKEATDGRYPEFALWENVPGALSSAGGRDFQAVLEAFAKGKVPMPESGRWADAGMVRGGRADIAWVVYDAQYFGTAQRRRRVFLVADLSGRRSGEVLFVPKSLRRYFEEGGTPRQGLAAYAEGGPGGAGGGGGAVPMAARGADGGAVYCIAGNIIGRQNHNGGNGMGFQEGISYTLTAMDRHAVSVPAVTMRIRSGCDGGGKGALLQIEKSGTLATGNDQYLFEPGTGALEVQGGSLLAAWPAAAAANGTATGQGNAGYRVRRLMPLECERLQGFPDHWTAWGHGGRQISDSKRYQMLGNSIAVPCAAYIMQGICQALGGIGEPSMSAMQGTVLI